MEPFSPQDPVSRLLGKARQVEPRPNFTQNVMRAVRQLPPQESAWDRLKDALSRWLPSRPLVGTACALLAVVMVSTWALKSPPQNIAGGPKSPTEAREKEQDPPGLIKEFDKSEEFDQLLAQQDTKSFSDNDLAALLY